ncbi:MAG TPA: IS1634 family transposase [Candidatus Dormibacteraeota bacterium]|nr:IS1634 family transposase [Candidatus Dormibacteraeota bacterium]
MYLRKTTKNHKGKTYTNYLLVESQQTPKGPRQRIICSLGALAPAPREHWLDLAHRLQASLQGQRSFPPVEVPIETLSKKGRRGRPAPAEESPSIAVDPERVTTERHREAGTVHVGHQLWQQLGLQEILQHAGLSDRACQLSEAMTLNRLIFPLSEHAMPDWMRRTALADILGVDFSSLHDDALYRNLDRLHPNRERIEAELAEREKTLFSLDDTLFLYDLTSTYFEGEAASNPQAKRGYSRDKRPDCKQVLVGLVLDRDGFPKAHEVFDGNRQDRTTVGEMLDSLEKRTGAKPGATVVVDRGMAYEEDLAAIRARGFHYLVASRQSERQAWLAEFEQSADWEEVLREPSPRNPDQKKSQVRIQRRQQGEEVYLLCMSEGREEKDRAIRETHGQRLQKDLQALKTRIEKGQLQEEKKIHQALGRLKERYPRVARYYRMDYQEIWRTYILLTRVEAAFRAMKSPLLERPIFHHLEKRTQTHIFLCVLAYHLLVAIEKHFLDRGVHTSWWTLREQLRTHQVVTVVLPTKEGNVLKIRKGSTPEPIHREIYTTLRIPAEVMKPIKTWHEPGDIVTE